MTGLSRRVREDDGVALLTVIGIMVVITILSIGSFVIARQTLHEAQRVED
jgi:Tfp pilus assembly protein PilX